MQHRRVLVLAALAAAALPAVAHHGWSSFDQNAPLYLEGQLTSVRWTNPHAEAALEVSKQVALPADLRARKMPSQQQSVDGAAIVARVQVPPAAEGRWELEFAPLPRMEAWGVPPLKVGDRIEVIGYTGVAGKPKLMRVEYLIVNGTAYGLCSSPAR
jgi:hypothetical protein